MGFGISGPDNHHPHRCQSEFFDTVPFYFNESLTPNCLVGYTLGTVGELRICFGKIRACMLVVSSLPVALGASDATHAATR